MPVNLVIVTEMSPYGITASKMTKTEMNVDEMPLDKMPGNNDCRINDNY
jgi:hypothetical protein